MKQPSWMWRVCVVFSFVFLLWACSAETGAPLPEVRPIPLSRSIRVPLRVLQYEPEAGPQEQSPAALVATAGAEDELPQGPQGFDVLEDGNFVICDPLQERLVFYDSEGAYLDQWLVGFPADSVTLAEGSMLRVRRANTGEFYAVNENGQARLLPDGMRARSGSGEAQEARLLGPNRGVITGERRRGEGQALEIELDAGENRMVSLSSLGTDENQFTYVVLETSSGGESIDVNKVIRKYDRNGRPVAQISDIPLDYYIHPVDEFRVRSGVVYQLAPHQDEVLIRAWDTN